MNGTGILCQNVSAGLTYVSMLMAEREVLMWNSGREGKYKKKPTKNQKNQTIFDFNNKNFN